MSKLQAAIVTAPLGIFAAPVANVIGQGIGVAVGLQDRFDWTGVAVAGVSAGVTEFASSRLPGYAANIGDRSAFNNAFSGAIGGVAGVGAYSALTGTSFGTNLAGQGADIVAGALGSYFSTGRRSGGDCGSDLLTKAVHAAGNIFGFDGTFGYQSGPGREYSWGGGSSLASVRGGLGDFLGFDGEFGYQGNASGRRKLSLGGLGRAFGLDWASPGSKSTNGWGETLEYGPNPSVAVGDLTIVDEVVLTAARRGPARASMSERAAYWSEVRRVDAAGRAEMERSPIVKVGVIGIAAPLVVVGGLEGAVYGIASQLINGPATPTRGPSVSIVGAGAAESAAGGVPRLGPKGVDPLHHNANVLVRDAQGNIVAHQRFVSGNMTLEEQALGFPRNTLASHTEARAVRAMDLQPGGRMTITGQSPPCPSCKGAMNQTATETGATIGYQWRQDGRTQVWIATPKGQ